MLKDLDAEVTTAQRPSPPCRAQGRWTCGAYARSEWISSLTTATSYRAHIRAIRSSSPADHTRPVGLCGEHNSSTAVSGSASSRSSFAQSSRGQARSRRPLAATVLGNASYIGVWATTPSPGRDHRRSNREIW